MKTNLLLVVTLFLFFGCSSHGVHHDKNTLAKFSGKKSFIWLEGNSPSDELRVNNPKINRLVRSSVEKELMRKGYVLTSSEEEAHIVLTWFGNVDKIVKEFHISSFYHNQGYGTLVGSEPDSVDGTTAIKAYQVGTLILDMIDPQTSTVFWRNTAMNIINKKMSDSKLSAYIDLSVSKLLENVPDADK